jgi:hypothetical protein
MVGVTKPGGMIIIVDAGLTKDESKTASLLSWIWKVLGDYMRDDALILKELVNVDKEDYGPWGSVYITIGKKE